MGATNEACYSFQKVDKNAPRIYPRIYPWQVQYRSPGTGHTTNHRTGNNRRIRRLWRSCSRVGFPRFPTVSVHPVLHRLTVCSRGSDVVLCSPRLQRHLRSTRTERDGFWQVNNQNDGRGSEEWKKLDRRKARVMHL